MTAVTRSNTFKGQYATSMMACDITSTISLDVGIRFTLSGWESYTRVDLGEGGGTPCLTKLIDAQQTLHNKYVAVYDNPGLTT